MREDNVSKINQLIASMNNNLIEIENTKSYLNKIKELNDEEILAPISNGIFLKAKLLDAKNLKVNVGHGVVVEKTIPQTIKILDKQKKEIEHAITKAKKEKEMLQNV